MVERRLPVPDFYNSCGRTLQENLPWNQWMEWGSVVIAAIRDYDNDPSLRLFYSQHTHGGVFVALAPIDTYLVTTRVSVRAEEILGILEKLKITQVDKTPCERKRYIFVHNGGMNDKVRFVELPKR